MKFFVGMVWALMTCAVSAADVVGTDIFSPEFKTKLAAQVPTWKVELDGSFPARQQWKQGTAKLALVLVRETDKWSEVETSGTVQSVVYAHAATLVMVHRSNTLNQINFSALAGVFAKDPRTRLLNWNDFPEVSRSELILPGMLAPAGSFTRELFQGLVLEGQPFHNEARIILNENAARETLTARSSSLVLMPNLVTPTSGKPLAVADGRPGKSSTPYSPTELNIYNGDYPLQLPLYLYYRTEHLNALRPLLKWLYSNEAAQLLQAQGLYPAPQPIRERYAQRLDTR